MAIARTSPARRAALVVATVASALVVPATGSAGGYGLVVLLAMAAALAQQTLP